MITISNLHKQFKTYHALKGINLHVNQGDIYGFIGQNGAGKSTTMNILAGLSSPTRGDCIVGGKDVKKIKHPSELPIGYLPEDPRFYPWMTAYETLNYLGNGRSGRADKARITEMLQWVGLSDAARRRVGGFSRGMKQRLGIAAALIHNPQLLILDEPSSALDPEGRSDVLRLIVELKQMNKTVIFSTHILSDVERICDVVGMIVSGEMVMEKPLAEIQKDNLIPIYDITLQSPWQREVIKKLSLLQGVRRVDEKDLTVSVTVEDAGAASSQLMQFLSEHELSVASFAHRKNTLEDIFIQEVNGK